MFFHDLPWKEDREGYMRRIAQYLEVADKHRIGTMFVIFDSVWDPHPKSGKQRAPRPHVHNSGWVQSPRADILKDPRRQDGLKPYVQDILRADGKPFRIEEVNYIKRVTAGARK